MNHISEPGHAATPPSFTAKQGQYLAFIHAYTLVLGRPPAEADLQRHFRVTPPSVHGMVLSLERSGLIRREPGRARSILVLIAPQALPMLEPS
jgi:DNA-binding MarR family transcriptional regulator